MLAITHYNRLLHELKPDFVHILVKGRIVASGGPELAEELERDGYRAFAPVEAEPARRPTGRRRYRSPTPSPRRAGAAGRPSAPAGDGTVGRLVGAVVGEAIHR